MHRQTHLIVAQTIVTQMAVLSSADVVSAVPGHHCSKMSRCCAKIGWEDSFLLNLALIGCELIRYRNCLRLAQSQGK